MNNLTQRQEDSLRKKIADIRKRLAAEKRKFGCYDDSRGVRYLPTRYFIQLGDYKAGLVYLNWFHKNFPDDSGFPDFLFESTIILFKCGKTKQATGKAFATFCRNTYVFEKFFGQPVTKLDKWEGSNLEGPDFVNDFSYSSLQPELRDFSEWLARLLESDGFKARCEQFLEINKRLRSEADLETRHQLVLQADQLRDNW